MEGVGKEEGKEGKEPTRSLLAGEQEEGLVLEGSDSKCEMFYNTFKLIILLY